MRIFLRTWTYFWKKHEKTAVIGTQGDFWGVFLLFSGLHGIGPFWKRDWNGLFSEKKCFLG